MYASWINFLPGIATLVLLVAVGAVARLWHRRAKHSHC